MTKNKPIKKNLKVKAGLKTRTIQVSDLARVEGEGGLLVQTQNGKVTKVELNIFEPPRFFEAFLKGRQFSEVPDITARICGICPVAYQMSSIHAIENALDVDVLTDVHDLRRLFYCGEWIESHVLHVTMLHLPDFLGLQDSLELAKKDPETLKLALRLKKAGNDIVRLIGGREIHPINIKAGGFYRNPSLTELQNLKADLEPCLDEMKTLIQKLKNLKIPELNREYLFVALHHPGEYAMSNGSILTSEGQTILISEYENHFQEHHVKHSNALHSTTLDGREYLVGPIARWNLNFNQLSEKTKSLAEELHLHRKVTNPFESIFVRSLEVFYAFDEALRILNSLLKKNKAIVSDTHYELPTKTVSGCAATEAPRGLLYHRYEINPNGEIEFAKIVPPTSQNQKTIESDVREVVEANLKLKDDRLTWLAEQSIRNYDPCISCATHFLKIKKEVV